MTSSYYPSKQIVPYPIWIGSRGDSENAAFFNRHKISLVINCSRDIPFTFPGHVQTYRVNVHDNKTERATILQYWPDAVKAIENAVSKKNGVLVHCYAGMQRSTATVAAYLIWKEGISAQEAMQRIKKRKSEAFEPVPTFDDSLKEWERMVMASRRQHGFF
jgi:predicted protein tyrosine phosphatase